MDHENKNLNEEQEQEKEVVEKAFEDLTLEEMEKLQGQGGGEDLGRNLTTAVCNLVLSQGKYNCR